MPWHSMCTRRRMLSHEVISCAGGAGDWQQPAAPMSCPRAVAARAVAATCLSGSQSCGPPTAAHRATTPAAGLLQMAIWDEMKEYGVDQNTINYNSLLSKSKDPRRNGGTRMGSQTAAVRLRPGHQGRQGFSACSPPRRRHAQCSSCLQSCKAHGWATQIKGLATAPSTSLVARGSEHNVALL